MDNHLEESQQNETNTPVSSHKKTKRRKGFVDHLLTLVLVAAIAVGGYAAYNLITIYREYKTGVDEYNDLANMAIMENVNDKSKAPHPETASGQTSEENAGSSESSSSGEGGSWYEYEDDYWEYGEEEESVYDLDADPEALPAEPAASLYENVDTRSYMVAHYITDDFQKRESYGMASAVETLVHETSVPETMVHESTADAAAAETDASETDTVETATTETATAETAIAETGIAETGIIETDIIETDIVKEKPTYHVNFGRGTVAWTDGESQTAALDVDKVAQVNMDNQKTTDRRASAIELNRSAVVPPLKIDFSTLKAVNDDVIGWLYVEALGDIINYPMVKGDDNEYYLHNTYWHTYNFSGTIFIDYQNSRDFSDPNTLIYGHNMKNGSMFGSLSSFITNASTFARSRYFWIFTPEAAYRYEIISAFTSPVAGEVYNLFDGPSNLFKDWMERMISYSGIPGQPQINTKKLSVNDKIVTLSTCTGDYSTRFVVLGRRVNTVKVRNAG